MVRKGIHYEENHTIPSTSNTILTRSFKDFHCILCYGPTWRFTNPQGSKVSTLIPCQRVEHIWSSVLPFYREWSICDRLSCTIVQWVEHMWLSQLYHCTVSEAYMVSVVPLYCEWSIYGRLSCTIVQWVEHIWPSQFYHCTVSGAYMAVLVLPLYGEWSICGSTTFQAVWLSCSILSPRSGEPV
jgi:hypothetical protein